MARTPEERRREDAGGDVPQREGGGQMGQQKSTGGTTQKPRETRVHTDPGRDAKPDMPGDPGGRVGDDGTPRR